MVTAPLLQQGIDVNLPKAKGKDLPTEERLTIVVRKGGVLFLNDSPISKDALLKKLTAVSRLNPNVFLRADKDVPYGLVVEIVGEVKEAGIEKLGIVTEPKMSLR
jgi:biopolymer transport protein ExbD